MSIKRILSVFLVLLLMLALLPAVAAADQEPDDLDDLIEDAEPVRGPEVPAPLRSEPTQISTCEELVTAVSEDGVGGNLILTADITLNANLFINKDCSLDLNGHTIDNLSFTIVVRCNMVLTDTSEHQTGNITGTGNFKIQIGTSSVNGNLTIESGSVISSSRYGISVPAKGNLVINGGMIHVPSYSIYDQGHVTINAGTILADTYPAVQVKGVEAAVPDEMLVVNGGLIEALGDGVAVNLHSNCAVTVNGGTIKALYRDSEEKKGGVGITCYKNTALTVNGGTISSASFGIAGNGSDSGSSEGTNAKFTIFGGTITSEYGAGIYAPQVNGETTIYGGSISGGRTGIEIRAGILRIYGGSISGNTEAFDCFGNSSGLTTKGAAISVCQHTTKQPITVIIEGGTFTGWYAFCEVNALGNSPEDVAKISYMINGGCFISTNDGAIGINVEDYPSTGFIAGGMFNNDVSDYLIEGYVQNWNETEQLWFVRQGFYLTIDESISDIVTADKTFVGEGDTVTLTVDEEAAASVRKLFANFVIDDNPLYIEVKCVDGVGTFIMPSADVNITEANPVFYGDTVNASDIAVFRDNEMLYRYDVMIRNLDEDRNVVSMQAFLEYDPALLTFVDAETDLQGSVDFFAADGVVRFAWATDGEAITVPDGMIVVSVYFKATDAVEDGMLIPLCFVESDSGAKTGFAYLNEDGTITEASTVCTEDGSIFFLIPDTLTFTGEDVIANNVWTIENGEVLYRYDVRICDLPDAGIYANSAQIFLGFDSDLLEVRRTEGALDWTVSDLSGMLMFAWASDSIVQLKNNDVVLTVWFAKANPSVDGKVDINFIKNPLDNGSAASFLFSGKIIEVEATTVDGSITFEAPVFGDANCDGVVTSADAALILRSLVGLSEITLPGMLNADVNGDGEVTAEDAAIILRYVVGLIDEIPVINEEQEP